jgi:2'-5' RNA ligase
MKRTFIAIRINAGTELLKLFSNLKSELGSDSVKWVSADQIHVTLAFLGDTNNETIRQVSGIVEETCKKTSQFSFNITGVGVFRSIRDAKVIWAGVEKHEELGSLFTVIKNGLEETGVKLEERAFRPHITLGRIKREIDKTTLERLIKQYEKKFIQKVAVSEVIYYESILKPTGPVYIPITKSSLKP